MCVSMCSAEAEARLVDVQRGRKSCRVLHEID